MSKELEALKIVDNAIKKYSNMSFNLLEANAILSLEQALQRLESIDNSNPSEALKCLEYIENKLHGLRVECERIKNHRCDDVFIQEHTFDTIKQALLKAQEPKHYLKWEDLEFKEEGQWLKVKLGDNVYRVDWYIDGLGANVVSLYKYITNDYLVYSACIKDNIQQFFNDLRLERVEE